ncbi:zinc finger protein 106 isoform X2 [Hoplias malabaricus]|uniref:zinc finger protein 106 isoform X2 n=1 Tax=Hoplias malabaricus TaxID=27720 RepID=UPI003462F210
MSTPVMKTCRLMKCPVCLHQYKEENLHTHMHSRIHHEVISKLKTGHHRCWACDMSINGLKQFKKHIATVQHITSLTYLQQHGGRRHGLTVDYTDKELAAICAKRDQAKRALKLQKRKELLKRKKERKAKMSQEGHSWQMNWTKTTQRDLQSSNQQSVGAGHKFNKHLHSKKGQAIRNQDLRSVLAQEPGLDPSGGKANKHKSKNILGWNSYYLQNPHVHYVKNDMEFTSDVLYPSWGIDFSSQLGQDSSEQSQSGEIIQGNAELQKTRTKLLDDADSLGTSQEKMPILMSDLNDSQTLTSDRLHKAKVNAHEDEEMSKSTKNLKPKPARKKILKKNVKEKTPELPAVPHVSDHSLEEPLPGFQPNASGSSKKSPVKKLSPQKKCLAKNRRTVCDSDFLKVSKTEGEDEQDPTQSTHGLPALLIRSVSKAKASKPNLTKARGIRTSQNPNMTKSESRVLTPALQKLISSKSSHRKVNWREMYEEATKRKLQREKGMPRFGIELVSPVALEPLELILEEVKDFALQEGLEWDSSVNPEDAAAYGSQSVEASAGLSTGRHDGVVSAPIVYAPMKRKTTKRAARMKAGSSRTPRRSRTETNEIGIKDTLTSGAADALAAAFEAYAVVPEVRSVCLKAEELEDYGTEHLQSSNDCSTPKDASKTNAPVSKMFQREDELSSFLEDVNNQLLVAQTAFHTAFRNFQQLQGEKQQAKAEMSSLISKRIEILRRIKCDGLGGTSSADLPHPATESHQRVGDASGQQCNYSSVESTERMGTASRTPTEHSAVAGTSSQQQNQTGRLYKKLKREQREA